MRYKAANIDVVHLRNGDEDQGWKQLQHLCPDLSDWGVATLRSGLDGYAKTVLIEHEYVCKDYRNIFTHFYSKKFVDRNPLCKRLHFFETEDAALEAVLMEPQDHQACYIGFSVIQPVLNKVSGKCIGRTVIDPLKCGHRPDAFYCLRTSFRVHLQGTDFEVCGYPFISQSGEATVCAHSALWGACRYLSERYRSYAELYPYDFVQLTSDTHGRRAPYRGMLYTDYSTILSAFGCHPVILRPNTFPGTSWLDDKTTFLDIYSYVESGFPVLASFRGHVATLIGHTTQSTLPFDNPDANGFHDSFALLDQYVVVDDNFFPYQLLGSHANDVSQNYGKNFENQLNPFPSKETIFAVVVPLPEKAFMEPQIARRIGTEFFAVPHIAKLVKDVVSRVSSDKKSPLITRMFLTSCTAFKKRKNLFATRDGDTLSQFPLRLGLPHFVWVIEVSPLSSFLKRKIIGEVVLDASASFSEGGFIYGRIGNRLIFDKKQSKVGNATELFSQYTHNLGER